MGYNEKAIKNKPRREMAKKINNSEKNSEENSDDMMPVAGGEKNAVAELINNLKETTHQETPDDYEVFKKPWNPDELWQKNGNYSIYEAMELDEQVSISLQIKKDLVLGDGYEITAMDEGQDDILEDLYQAIDEDYEGDFMSSIEEMLDAYGKGFSLTEKVFKYRADGSLTLKCLKTRHPNTWKIYTDKKGNIEKYVQENTKDGTLEIKPKQNKLIHYINRGKYQNPYGTSDLRVAYEAWFTKREVMKYYAIFLERVASPKAVGKYPTNAPSEFKNTLLGILKKFQAKTSLVIPKEAEVEWLEATNNGEAYNKALNYLNMMIGRSLFVPDLAGFQGSETSGGAYSLGKEQIGIQLKHLAKRKQLLENIINKQLLRQVIIYNHGFVVNPPQLKFKPISDSASVDYARLWLEAVKGKTYKPSDNEINHFRNIVKFPEGDVDRFDDNPVLPFGGIRSPIPVNENKPEIAPDKTAIDKEDAEKNPGEVKGYIFKKPTVDHAGSVDFKSIKKFMDGSDDRVASEGKVIIDQIYEDIIDQIIKKKILEKQDLSRFETVKIRKLKDVKQLLNRTMKEAYAYGGTTARQEILGRKNFNAPIMDEKFLKIIDDENFSFVGDWEYEISKNARIGIVQAIKDGKPISSVAEFMDENKAASQVALERYARTKSTEVLNNARVEFFNSIEFVVGYQYSAILDSRTSMICAGLHGKRFKKGSEPRPALHFNCRSLLIPITQFEDPEFDSTVGGEVDIVPGETMSIPKMNIDKFIEKNKGKGFPKR